MCLLLLECISVLCAVIMKCDRCFASVMFSSRQCETTELLNSVWTALTLTPALIKYKSSGLNSNVPLSDQ